MLHFDGMMLRAMAAKPSRDDPSATMWRKDGRPRVLIEEGDPAMAWADERVLSREGFDVVVCEGPGERSGGCPLLETGACALADQADAVVVGLSMSHGPGRELVAAHRARRRSDSLCVEALAFERERFETELEGTNVLRVPVTRSMLVDGVRRAVGQGPTAAAG